MLSTGYERPMRILVLTGSVALVLTIAVSRILLHAHTPAEVVVGLLIGLCCTAWFGLDFLNRSTVSLRSQSLVVVILALAVALPRQTP